jgi:uncharacterized protein
LYNFFSFILKLLHNIYTINCYDTKEVSNRNIFKSNYSIAKQEKRRLYMSSIIKRTLYIDNMTCVNCENVIERELAKAEGVVSVKASYSAGTAEVTYDEALITIEQMKEILEKEDYHARTEPKGKQTAQSSMEVRNSSENRSSKAPEQSAQNGKDYTNIVAVGVIIFALYILANRFGLTNIFNAFPVAKDGMGYGMLFIIGLLTSVHCVAMCGGICLSQCVPKTDTGVGISKYAALRPSLLYNIGRVISYTIIGGIVGALGSVISFSGTMKGIVQILAGVFMVIMGLNMLNIFPWLRKFNPRMPKIFAKKIYAQRNNNSPLYIGLLNGLMPCGPLQAMQLYALSTGSPVKGAISMFLFSVGTVPLMFAFGALSSFLSKKFTHKMMSVSAVLVIVLGVFMFNNGMGLSGIYIPSMPFGASTAKAANYASIEGDTQVVTTGLSSGQYEPIVVQKGIPVKWIIQAEQGDINGCNNSIIVQKYGIQKNLKVGDNVIEFTPTESGTVPFSCWMGMIRSTITIVDDLNNVDADKIAADSSAASSAGGSCCAGGGVASGSGSTGSGSASSDSSSGLQDFNNLLGAQIPTGKVAVAEIKDEVQTVQITYDENGFSPAVVVVEKGQNTEWIINGSNVDASKGSIIFPYYYAQLAVEEGENPIRFFPDQDFDFFTSDGSYTGYVKVVDDIDNIDIEAIKEEVSNYTPTDIGSYSGGSGASCH